MSAPSNHRQAERAIIELVRYGEWSIDEHGCIWRTMVRRGNRWRPGTFQLVPCARRRVEKHIPSGYLMVRASIEGKRVCGMAHRLVWQHLNGNIPDGECINHKNGIKFDNHPSNLEVVTYSSNMEHAHSMRLLDQRGEVNPHSKLSNSEVAAIRAMYAAGGWTMTTLAGRFGVVFQTISEIVHGYSRATQGGPIMLTDLRHSVCDRDPVTGRFMADLRVRQWPEVGR